MLPGSPGRPGRWLAGMVALALLLAACRAAPMETGQPAPSSPSPPPVESPGSPEPRDEEGPEPQAERVSVPRELRFTAPQLGGGQIRGAEYAGRDVAIWFWAPW